MLVRARASASILVQIRSTGHTTRPAHFEVLARPTLGNPVTGLSADDGSAQFHLPLGDYEIYVGPTSFLPIDARRVALNTDGQVVQVALSEPTLFEISGTVLDAAGVPVPDEWINAESAAREATGMPLGVAALTNERGEFTLKQLIEGAYNIIVGERRRQLEARPVQAGATDVVLSLMN